MTPPTLAELHHRLTLCDAERRRCAEALDLDQLDDLDYLRGVLCAGFDELVLGPGEVPA